MLLNPLPLVISAAELCDIMLWILKVCPTKYDYPKILHRFSTKKEETNTDPHLPDKKRQIVS